LFVYSKENVTKWNIIVLIKKNANVVDSKFF